MAYNTFRTSNRQSVSFKVRKFLRRTRTRILTELIQMLDGTANTTAAA
jgi:hypothetical protein